MMPLEDLLKRIAADRIGQSETLAVLRDHLGKATDAYVRQKLQRALTSAVVFYSPQKRRCGSLADAKAQVIADITKAKTCVTVDHGVPTTW